MNTEISDNIIGRCCRKKGKYIITFDGCPSENYSVILCDYHSGQPPYNKNILKVIPLEKN